MEYREGKGLVLFCQMDVTGRTENDPAAQTLVANLLHYASAWKPDPARRAVYAGEQAGRDHLKSCGVDAATYEGGALSPAEQVLIIGPGGGKQIAGHTDAISRFLNQGGRVLGIALDQNDAGAALPFKIEMKTAEHINAVFDPPALRSLLAGIGPADVSARAPLEIPLVVNGAAAIGDGVLALAPADAPAPGVVLDQIAPWRLDYKHAYDLKRTFRRASFTLTRLLANLGVAGSTPLLERIGAASPDAASEKRWLDGLYLDTPEEWDDPYRFFRW
jgi:hypothetical protein